MYVNTNLFCLLNRRKKGCPAVISGNFFLNITCNTRGVKCCYFSFVKISFVLCPFSALLNSASFHISLMACSLEVLMADKGLPSM